MGLVERPLPQARAPLRRVAKVVLVEPAALLEMVVSEVLAVQPVQRAQMHRSQAAQAGMAEMALLLEPVAWEGLRLQLQVTLGQRVARGVTVAPVLQSLVLLAQAVKAVKAVKAVMVVWPVLQFLGLLAPVLQSLGLVAQEAPVEPHMSWVLEARRGEATAAMVALEQ